MSGRSTDAGLLFEASDGRRDVTALADVQKAFAEVGAAVWPLDLSRTPEEIRALLRKPSPAEEERKTLLQHFLLPRERLLEIIAAAGREPHVTGGGELVTRVENQGASYPLLHVSDGEADFSRFDRFHRNHSSDGVYIDEIVQVLCGEGLVIRFRRPDGVELTLRVSCPDESAGWLLFYAGDIPHIGSMSDAVRGTKCVVQAIGPPVWNMNYVD